MVRGKEFFDLIDRGTDVTDVTAVAVAVAAATVPAAAAAAAAAAVVVDLGVI